MTSVVVFTARSTGIGIATGVLVAAAFWLIGAPLGLAILNGLVTGATVLHVPVAWRLGRLKARQPLLRPWHGIFAVGYPVVTAPAFFVGLVIDELDPATRFALGTLILITGLAGFAFGDIVATLDHLDGDADSAGPGVTPPPGERHAS